MEVNNVSDLTSSQLATALGIILWEKKKENKMIEIASLLSTTSV